MRLATFTKQPADHKDYDIDYAPWLTAQVDTLEDAQATVQCLSDPADTALTVLEPMLTATRVKLWVSGGTDGFVYKVTVRVTTTGGRVDESELLFVVVDA